MWLAPNEFDQDGVVGTVQVTGLTHSLVSATVVSRGLATKFPLGAAIMELAALL